jgi:hypothetical protein
MVEKESTVSVANVNAMARTPGMDGEAEGGERG